ncbi:hypothetical protein [Mucilaginibacter sp.]|uniref:hypothetical protein n=1 Tax=Mucilaginibacter sp. TaxID=1882438 RepID=UPI00326463FC
MSKKANEERAKEIFGAYGNKDVVYFSGDGSAFFSESDCINHAKTLDDKGVSQLTRVEVMPGTTDAEELDGDDDLITQEQKDELAKQARAILEAEYLEATGKEAGPDQKDATLKTAITKANKAKIAGE